MVMTDNYLVKSALQAYDSFIFDCDSYKLSHYAQLPPGLTYTFSYIESRGGKHDEILFFGLQAYIKRYLVGQVLTESSIYGAQYLYGLHFGRKDVFPTALWLDLLKKHDGRLPIRIKAVREGTKVGTKNVLVTVESTDPEFAWLVGVVETSLLRGVWYPTTVATNCLAIKKMLLDYHRETSDLPKETVDLKLCDFGFRGVSSKETGQIGSMSHQVLFKGSDTVGGLTHAKIFYGGLFDSTFMPAFSIPAAEHYTITSWTRARELDAYRNMLKFGKDGLVAVVSDSYDLWNAIEMWGGELRDEVLSLGGGLVIRPDSGDPTEVPVKTILRLMELFPTTTNSKGFRVLTDKVRVIQGDGMNLESLCKLIENLIEAKISIDNIAFGMGGGLLQAVTRDDQKFAMKCSRVIVDGQNVDVFKDPVTDPGKKSKTGIQYLIMDEDGEYRTVNDSEFHDGMRDMLELVFEDGALYRDQTYAEVRALAEA